MPCNCGPKNTYLFWKCPLCDAFNLIEDTICRNCHVIQQALQFLEGDR